MACEPEQSDDDDRSAQDRQHGLAADEAEPELERDGPERDRNDECGPPQQCEQSRAPPLQDRALVGRERHRREHGERDDGDGSDLLADSGLDGRGRASAARSGPPSH